MNLNRLVRPRVLIRLLAWAAACAALPACNDDISGGDHIDVVTTRVNSDKEDHQVTDFGASFSSLSADGSILAFQTASNQIDPGPPSSSGNPINIFIKNRHTRVPVRVSIKTDPGALTIPQGATFPSISPDGTVVTFQCVTKLANGAAVSTGTSNIYLHDLNTHTTKPVIDPDIWPNLNMGNGSVTVINDITGRYALVAFSTAANIGNGAPASAQIYVSKVMLSASAIPVVTLVSRGTASAATFGTGGDSLNPRISEDGSTVAFESKATNLHAGDADTISDIFAGTPTGTLLDLVSLNNLGTKADGDCTRPAISKDGRYVAFVATGTAMVGAGIPANIVRRDRIVSAPKTDFVSRNSAGTPADLACVFPRISGDGMRVIFGSTATSLLPNTSSGFSQVYLKDFNKGSLEIVSVNRNLEHGDQDCALNPPDISSDGSTVSWDSLSANLVPFDTNGLRDIFTRGPTQ